MTKELIAKSDIYQTMLARSTEQYRYGTQHLVNYLRERGEVLTYQGFSGFVDWLRAQYEDGRWAAETVNSYINAAKYQVRQALDPGEGKLTAEERYEIERQLGKVKRLKVQRKPITEDKVLSDEECERFLEVCPDERVRCWFSFLRDHATRVSEMLGIQRADLKDRGDYYDLKIRGKGSKERTDVLEKPELAEIQRIFGNGKYLFQSPYRDKATRRVVPYSRFYVSHAIERHAKRILKRHVTAHTLRHTWATNAVKTTKRYVAVQNKLGHASAATTLNMYVHDSYSREELQDLRLKNTYRLKSEAVGAAG